MPSPRSVSGVVPSPLCRQLLHSGERSARLFLGTSGVAALEAKSIRNNGYSILRDNTAVIHGLSNEQANQLDQQLVEHSTDFNFVDGYQVAEYAGDYVTGQCLALNQYVEGLDCGQGQLVGIDFYLSTDDQRQIIYANDMDELQSKVSANMEQIYSEQEDIDVEELMQNQAKAYIVGVNGSDTERLRSTVAKLTGGSNPTGGVDVTSAL